MSVIMTANHYGKSNVRLVKVIRNGSRHEIKELLVNILLEGDFEKAHVDGDNTNILPTDTMKNTVYALAKDHPLDSIEHFGKSLAKHFVDNNPQLSCATIDLSESLWNRMKFDGLEHNHAFTGGDSEKRLAIVSHSKTETAVTGGLDGLLILKTTDSGFSKFKRDKYTTLKDTDDRIFATQLKAVWTYAGVGAEYTKTHQAIRNLLLETFAGHKSLSVQQTLHAMGSAVLEKTPIVKEIHLTMPNKHCLLVNLEPFGLSNSNEIFVPTDEPFGLIEAALIRA